MTVFFLESRFSTSSSGSERSGTEQYLVRIGPTVWISALLKKSGTVANARFSLLKLLIYEPYYCYALVGWSARPRLEP